MSECVICGRRLGWFSEPKPGLLICENDARQLVPKVTEDLAAWDAKGVCGEPGCDKAKGHLGRHMRPAKVIAR